MEECTSIAEASGYVWKNALALQRLVDTFRRMHKYSRGKWTCIEEYPSIAEVSGCAWKNALVMQRLVDMYGRMP